MKIGQLDPKAVLAQATPAERKAAKPAAGAEASAQVVLSNAASALATDEQGSFDAAKVERIAQAIRDGNFKVNAEAIADKLIANAQDLFGRKTN